VDENNTAVRDFSVSLSKGKKQASALTDAQGRCSFSGIKKTSYLLNGKKDGFTAIEESLSIDQKGSVLCFKVISWESALDTALQLYEDKMTEEAFLLLEKLYFKSASPGQLARNFCKACLFVSQDKKEQALNELTILKDFENAEVQDLLEAVIRKMEE
jgi:hypothetical protein